MDCIFCNTELYPDSVYVTDGETCVCSMCASRHSLYEVAIYCANNNVSSNVSLHRPSVIDYGLNVQTDEDADYGLNVQTDEDADEFVIDNTPDESTEENKELAEKLADKNANNVEYGKAVSKNANNVEYGKAVSDDYGLNVQTDDRAKTEEELAHDIDNMSHEDFFSKYADNPDVLHAYVYANGEPSDAFLNV